jgi:hypothetical protein
MSSASSELRFHHFVTSKHLQKTPLVKKDLVTWLFYILKKLLKLILLPIIDQFDADSTERDRRLKLT